MDTAMRDRFLSLWRRYFNNTGLPIAFYYTNETGRADPATEETPRCVIGALGTVRQGNSLCLEAETVGCPGGRRYLGFAREIAPGFEYFLSHGIPGRLRGERYVKTPEMVKKMMEQAPLFTAPARYIVFKRWDKL